MVKLYTLKPNAETKSLLEKLAKVGIHVEFKPEAMPNTEEFIIRGTPEKGFACDIQALNVTLQRYWENQEKFLPEHEDYAWRGR